MDRADRLVFCEKCSLREFSGKLGLICSLTKERAAFEGTCPDFQEDQSHEIKRQEKAKPSPSISIGPTLGFIVLAIVWFVVGRHAFGYRFYIPGTIIFIGFLALMISKNRQKKSPVEPPKNDGLLDSDL